jgi:superfamily II DNA or RNA helicase
MLDPIPAYYAQKFASAPSDALHARFTPDYTPEQLENLGVYDALYRGKSPRLASLGEWKPEWISEHDPKGWAQWYKRYASGRRLEGEDDRQMKRWLSFKARHGGPFVKNPTPRRGWALRNWGIDPSKLAPDQAQQINEMLDDHQRKAMQKFVQEKAAVARWRMPDALLAFAKKNLTPALQPQNYKNLTRGEALENAMQQLGRTPLEQNFDTPLSKFFSGFNKKLLAEGTPSAIPSVTAKEPATLFRKLRSAHTYPKPDAPVPYVHGSPHAGALSNPHYGSSMFSAQFNGRTPLFARYKPAPGQTYGPDYHLDSGLPGMRWADIPAHLRSRQGATYETPITAANQFMGYGVGLPGGSEKYHALPNTQAWKNVFGGKHGLMNELMPAPNSQTTRTPEIIEHGRGLAQNALREMQKTSELLPEIQLQEHQQRVADRVADEDPRLLVYHGLGSGKSLSALAAAEAARKVSGGEYGVVVPASLRGNFQKEIKKFTRNSNPEILSYTGLALGKKFKQPPETVVMDEAQRLRNPGAAATQSAEEVARQAKRLVLLSGTPITNSPTDLASLMSLLDNKPMSPQDFEKRYIGYRKKFPGVIPWLRGAQWGEEPYVRNEKELRERLKGKVDYQPSKTPQGVTVNEETVKVPLSSEQAKIQKAIRTQIPPGFLWKLDQEFPLSRDELKKLNSFLTGLRQVSLSTQPFRVDKDPLKAFDQSSKLREAMKRLRENLDSDPRRKAIVYSNFIDSGVNPYAKALDREKIPYGVFHGGIPVKARQEALKNYNEGKLRALLLGPAAAEGISTKGTSLIQLLDPYWHESRTQQARGRGLRFDSHEGLPEELKNVAVQRFLSASEEPGLFSKYVLGKRRQRTGDEVLQHLSDNKERLNEAFRKILRDVGAEKHKPKPADQAKIVE